VPELEEPALVDEAPPLEAEVTPEPEAPPLVLAVADVVDDVPDEEVTSALPDEVVEAAELLEEAAEVLTLSAEVELPAPEREPVHPAATNASRRMDAP
jgi:hypothetical protein